MAFAQKFIVADDHPLFRAALTQALRQVAPQAEIVEADTMEATNQMVTRHPDADLILLDLHLPDMKGEEVLRELRSDSRTSGIPVLVISADATPRQIHRLRLAGARGYLTKPLDLDEFLSEVDAALAEEELAPPPA